MQIESTSSTTRADNFVKSGEHKLFVTNSSNWNILYRSSLGHCITPFGSASKLPMSTGMLILCDLHLLTWYELTDVIDWKPTL